MGRKTKAIDQIVETGGREGVRAAIQSRGKPSRREEFEEEIDGIPKRDRSHKDVEEIKSGKSSKGDPFKIKKEEK